MRKILVVEDSITQQELIKDFLKDMQLPLIFARDGIEALFLVKRECPAIVILDIVMPRMNGYEVCRRLKSNCFTQKPAVVMYSTKCEKSDFYWGMKQGADAYVSKLDRPHVLVDTIEMLLQKMDNPQEADRARLANLQSELIAQIKRLYSNLRVYKKAQSNRPTCSDNQYLTSVVVALEAEINTLEAQLEACFAFDGITRTRMAS